jgi:hypothetical protein
MTVRRFPLYEELELSCPLLPVNHLTPLQSGQLPCSFRIVTSFPRLCVGPLTVSAFDILNGQARLVQLSPRVFLEYLILLLILLLMTQPKPRNSHSSPLAHTTSFFSPFLQKITCLS